MDPEPSEKLDVRNGTERLSASHYFAPGPGWGDGDPKPKPHPGGPAQPSFVGLLWEAETLKVVLLFWKRLNFLAILDKRKAGHLSGCQGSCAWVCIDKFRGSSPAGLLNGK